MGFEMNYAHPSEIMDEIASLTPTFSGVSYAKLDELGSVQWPCNEKMPLGTPVMHIDGFVRRPKGKFVITEYVATDERTGPRYPLLLTTGRILSQYNVGAQTRRTDNIVWHEEDRLEMHPHDAEQRGVRWRLVPAAEPGRRNHLARADHRAGRAGPWSIPPSTTPTTQANVITTEYSDWATIARNTRSPRCRSRRPTVRRNGRRNMTSRPVIHAVSSMPWKPRNSPMHDPVRTVHRQVWRDGSVSEGTRAIPEETALALTYNGGTYAVMMGTPQDLADFAVGFSLSEGIVQSAGEIESLEIVDLDDGIEVRMWLAAAKADRLSVRRRMIAGPTGCGLCGIDSIAEAVRPAAIVAHGRQFSPHQIMTAMQAVPALQKINHETRTVHAAAFWTPARGIVALREDVGRHNALDKLAGALALEKVTAGDGMMLLTSRVSVEMVQKTATIGAPLMVAVSAPTALAVRMADAAGITLVAIARSDGFEVFTHADRIASAVAKEAARVDVA